jgi:hypothetical protein
MVASRCSVDIEMPLILYPRAAVKQEFEAIVSLFRKDFWDML